MLAAGQEERIVRLLKGLGSNSGIRPSSGAMPKVAGWSSKGLREFREHLGGELTITLLRDIGVGRRCMSWTKTRSLHAIAWLAQSGGRSMILDGGRAHLTYCSNIHPGETWAEVRANLERYVPSVRDSVAPGQPFGIGLRLSAQAASDLSRVPSARGTARLLGA
jgi:hypothetical protein